MGVQQGTNMLLDQLQSLQVPHGHLAVWALGQQGYLFKGGEHIIIIDPYLSENVADITGDPSFGRQVPVVVQPSALTMVELALATHAHADHCDPKTLVPLMQAARQARVITSYTGKDLLIENGVAADRIEVPTIGEAVEHGEGLTITAIPSAHYGFEPDAAGNPSFLGFIIQINGVTLYHSGDSIIYDGLVDRLQKYELDLVCLPINGRDWFREQQDLVGNMDYREAANLAATVGAKVLLPGHNDMFAGNRINPAYLLDYLTTNHPGQRVHFLKSGELYYYAG